MKIKKEYKIIAFVLVILVLIGVGIGIRFANNDSIIDYENSEKYTIKNGEYVGDPSRIQFGIDKSGKYEFTIEVNCDECPGFVTAVILKDADNNVVFWDTGAYFTVSGRQLELNEGLYTVDFEIIPGEKELNEFINALDSSAEVTPFEEARDGEWEVQRIYRVEGKYINVKLFLLLAFLTGLALAGSLVALMTDGNKQIYDERQKINQGKAYKYAFFTILIYVLVLWLLRIMEFNLPVRDEVALLIGVIAALVVFVEYSIFKDCYLAINTKKVILLVSFGVLDAISVLMCVLNIFFPSKFAYMTVIIAIFMTVVMVSVIIKLLVEKRRNMLEDGKED